MGQATADEERTEAMMLRGCNRLYIGLALVLALVLAAFVWSPSASAQSTPTATAMDTITSGTYDAGGAVFTGYNDLFGGGFGTSTPVSFTPSGSSSAVTLQQANRVSASIDELPTTSIRVGLNGNSAVIGAIANFPTFVRFTQGTNIGVYQRPASLKRTGQADYTRAAGATSELLLISGQTTTLEYFYTRTAPPTSDLAPDDPPTGITASNPQLNTIDISWDAVPDATGYSLQYRVLGGPPAYTTFTFAGTNARLTGLTTATTYQYRVATIQADATLTDYSELLTFRTLAELPAPGVPTGVTIGTVTLFTANVSWTAGAQADEYTVEWRINRQGTDWQTARVSSTSILIESLEPNTPYLVRVQSVRNQAPVSAYSDTASFTTPPRPDTPGVPSVLVVSGVTDISAVVTWQPGTDAEEYQLEWRENIQGVPFVDMVRVVAPSTSYFFDEELKPSTTYAVRVRSIRENADPSAWTAEVTFITPAAIGQPTGVVLGFNRIQWIGVPNVHGYTVQFRRMVSNIDDGAWQHCPAVEGDVTSLAFNLDTGVSRSGEAAYDTDDPLNCWLSPLRVYEMRVLSNRLGRASQASDIVVRPENGSFTRPDTAFRFGDRLQGQVAIPDLLQVNDDYAIVQIQQDVGNTWFVASSRRSGNGTSTTVLLSLASNDDRVESFSTRERIPTPPTYTFTGLSPNTEYYVIHGIDGRFFNSPTAAERRSWWVSPRLYFRTLPATANLPLGAPGMPEVGPNSRLTWSIPANAQSVSVQWRSTGSLTWHEIPDIQSLSYTIPYLIDNVTYQARIVAHAPSYPSSPPSPAVTFTRLPPPGPPQNISVSALTRSADITWEVVTISEGYGLEWRPVGTNSWQTAVADSGVATSYTISGLDQTTTYELRMRTLHSVRGDSEYSDIVNFTTTPPLTLGAPVPYVLGQPGAVVVAVAWDEIANADGYTWVLESGGSEVRRNTIRTTDVLFTGLSASTDYTLSVVANFSQPDSTSAEGVVIFTTAATGPAMLPAPRNIRATGITSTTVDIAWDLVPNANGYNWSIAEEDGTEVAVGTASALARSATVTGLTSATTYRFNLIATSTSPLNFSPSTEGYLEVMTENLEAPTNISIVPDVQEATVTWTRVTEGTGYTLEWRPVLTQSWQSADVAGSNITTYTISGLRHSQEYDFRMKATHPTVGDSPYSEIIQFTTDTPPAIQAPQPYVVGSPGANVVAIAWNEIENTDAYTWAVTSGGSEVLTNTTTQTSVVLTSLTAETDYTISVVASFTQLEISSPPGVADFTTAATGPAILASPENVRSVRVMPTTARVEWDTVRYATGYSWRLLRGMTEIATGTASTLTPMADLSGLLTDTEYTFAVRATSTSQNFGDSAESTLVLMTTVSSLDAPVPAVQGEPGATVATIAWPAVPGADNYVWSLATGGSTVLFNQTGGTSVTFTTLDHSTPYTFRIFASAQPNIVSPPAVLNFSTATSGSGALETPVVEVIGLVGDNDIRLGWQNVSNAARYEWTLMRGDTQVSSGDVGLSSVRLSGLLSGTDYTFSVIATPISVLNFSNSSPGTFNFRTTGAPPGPGDAGSELGYPGQPTIYNIVDNSASFIWAGAANAEGYVVELREAGETEYQNIGMTSISTLTFNATALTAGTRYEVRILSVQGNLRRASPVNRFTTTIGGAIAPTPTPPTGIGNVGDFTNDGRNENLISGPLGWYIGAIVFALMFAGGTAAGGIPLPFAAIGGAAGLVVVLFVGVAFGSVSFWVPLGILAFAGVAAVFIAFARR